MDLHCLKPSKASIAAAALLCCGISGEAAAAEVVLNFDGFACSSTNSGPTNKVCEQNGERIGSDYGTTPLVAVSSAIAPGATGAGTNLFHYAGTAFGGTAPGAYGFNNGTGSPGSGPTTITFAPLAGYELSILGFRYGRTNATFLEATFEVADALGNTLFTHSGNGGAVAVNTAYSTGPLRFLFTTQRGNPFVADLRYDIRPTAVLPPVGAVPEPATWALMISGFGMVGGVLRRRRTGTMAAA